MEAQIETERRAPLRIGGIPDMENETTPWALEIPGALSFLAFGSFDAEVRGLRAFPRDEWPPVPIVHYAFQLMVALGMFMAALGVWTVVKWIRKRDPADDRWLLRALVIAAPMGFIATEAGWVVTEVGRQPWIIYGIVRTADAVTPMPGLVYPFAIFTVLYILLSIVVVILLHRQVVRSPAIYAGAGVPLDGGALPPDSYLTTDPSERNAGDDPQDPRERGT